MFKRFSLALIVVLAVKLHSTGLRAEENSAEVLPETVVTAQPDSLLSPTPSDVAAALASKPAATSIVEPEDFSEGRGAYLDDFLRFAPGVYLQPVQGEEVTKLSVRGSGLQDDSVKGTEILVDGMPLNQGDGEAFLQDVSLPAVKYAELYRGADALRYGAVTLGGAMNFVTRTGHDADPFSIRVTAGSFDFFQEQASSGYSKGPFDLYFCLLNESVDGYREWSQENNQKVFLSLGEKLGAEAENRVYFFFGHLDQNNPDSLTKQQLLLESAPDHSGINSGKVEHLLGLRADH